ncbi:hypothetical protein [Haloglomus litoreum]|uniref:hypothetical protein n=1 Tax=Haloglomus litoreum TaxID=3034026 RepID=UPI0023E8F437|nr:hypothetical protein [Haloglomus sp. DT116]
MSTRRRPPEPLVGGYSGPLGRRLLRVRRRCRRARESCRAAVRHRIGSTRTFPFDPSDMRLAYGYRQVLLTVLVLSALGWLGMRLFATELFRALVSRDLLLVCGFNAGISASGLVVGLACRRYWRWSRRASVRFTALVDALAETRRL